MMNLEARTRRSKQVISDIMRRVRSFDTRPERVFRKALWSQGFRYRVHEFMLPGKPDIVLPARRMAIFIDGDFWHGSQWRGRRLLTLEGQFERTESRNYWIQKIRRTMRRDCEVTSSLLSKGWTVLRFWESEINKDLKRCVTLTVQTLKKGVKPDRLAMLPQKTFAEFFAGIGLMRMGLEKQGWKIAFANDIDPAKLEMYKAQFEDTDQNFALEDIHRLSAEKLPDVTLATASFPCNDLSLAGARSGLKGKNSSAYWGFIRVLSDWGSHRPPLVLLENVTGFLTSHKGEDFRQALLALNNLGYTVDAFILDAARFVPQSRERLFVIGVLDECFSDREVRQTRGFYESILRPKALAGFIFTHPEIRWNIRSLPPPPENTNEIESILDDLPEDSPVWWDPKRAEYLLKQMSPRHRKLADEMVAGRRWSYGTVFRRMRNGRSMAELRTDGVAGCLRTPRGGSARQILFKAGKGKYFVRLLTPRENARLMGADEFHISVPLNQALFGFGDAVCVPVIEWIASYYLNPLVTELSRGRPLRMAV